MLHLSISTIQDAVRDDLYDTSPFYKEFVIKATSSFIAVQIVRNKYESN